MESSEAKKINLHSWEKKASVSLVLEFLKIYILYLDMDDCLFLSNYSLITTYETIHSTVIRESQLVDRFFLKGGVLNTSIFVIKQSWHVYIHHIFLYCAVRILINCETSIDSNYSLISKDVEMTIPKQGSGLHSCSITGMKYVKNCPSSKYLGITYFINIYSQLETYIHF